MSCKLVNIWGPVWSITTQEGTNDSIPVLKIMVDGEEVSIRYQYIKCHLIFDFLMDFSSKAIFFWGSYDRATRVNNVHVSGIPGQYVDSTGDNGH